MNSFQAGYVSLDFGIIPMSFLNDIKPHTFIIHHNSIVVYVYQAMQNCIHFDALYKFDKLREIKFKSFKNLPLVDA